MNPYLAVFAPSRDAVLNLAAGYAPSTETQLSSAHGALRLNWLCGVPPRAACRPRPPSEPIATYYGMPIWVDPLCPRGTWYVLGVYDPEPEWPSIAAGVQ